MYFNTYITGSPLKPIMLKRVNGKQKEINKNILILQFFKNKCKIKNDIP